MLNYRRVVAGAALAATITVGGEAIAGGDVQVDTSGGWHPAGVCTLGQACAGQTLPFYIDVGHGLTNRVYTYDNGLTSIGHELVAPPVPLFDGVPMTNYSYSLADFAGQDYFTPYYANQQYFDVGGTPHVSGGTLGGAIVATHNFPNLDFVVQGATAVRGSSSGFPTYIEFILTPIAGTHQGAFQLLFNYGDSNIQTSPIFDNESGYSFGPGHHEDSFIGFGPSFFRFDLGSTPLDTGGGIPEPAAWALMIAGLGGVGAALRSRRRPAVAAA